jgi:hypothetical protein
MNGLITIIKCNLQFLEAVVNCFFREEAVKYRIGFIRLAVPASLFGMVAGKK